MASVVAGTDLPVAHGHSFGKKTFHKPTYCHHCSDMLWGLIQQGFICEGKQARLHPPNGRATFDFTFETIENFTFASAASKLPYRTGGETVFHGPPARYGNEQTRPRLPEFPAIPAWESGPPGRFQVLIRVPSERDRNLRPTLIHPPFQIGTINERPR